MAQLGGLSQRLNRIRSHMSGSCDGEVDNGDACAISITAALATLAFGFELGNPTLGVDDYLHLGQEFSWDSFWISRGMWGGLLLHYLIPGGWIVPFISLVTGLFICIMTAVVIGWIIKIDRLTPSERGLLYALFVTFPYFFDQMAFSYLQIGYPLSALFTVAGICIALKANWPRFMIGATFIAAGLSIYQGAISFLAPIMLLAAIYNSPIRARGESDAARFFQNMIWFCGVGGAGAIIYFLLHRAVVLATGATPSSEYYSLTLDFNILDRFPAMVDAALYLHTGAGGIIPELAIALFVGLSALLTFSLLTRLSLSRFFMGCLIYIGLVFSPFAVMLLHNGIPPPRGVVGISLVWFATFATALASDRLFVRRLARALLMLCIILFAFQCNAMFFSQALTAEADRLMMTRIAERVDRLDRGESIEQSKINIVVVGSYSHPEYPGIVRHDGSVLGFSQFEWDGGNVWRMQALARAIGVDRYDWRPVSDVGHEPKILDEVSARKPWPSSNSVFAFSDSTILWLGQRRIQPRENLIYNWIKGFYYD